MTRMTSDNRIRQESLVEGKGITEEQVTAAGTFRTPAGKIRLGYSVDGHRQPSEELTRNEVEQLNRGEVTLKTLAATYYNRTLQNSQGQTMDRQRTMGLSLSIKCSIDK